MKQYHHGLRCKVLESSNVDNFVGCGDIEVSLDVDRDTYRASMPAHW